LTEEETNLFNDYYQEATALLKPYMFLQDVGSRNSTTEEAQKDLNRSVELFVKALEIYPESWPSHWLLGKAYQALQQPEKAYESFKSAYSIMPDNPDVVNEYFMQTLEIGKTEEALNIAKEGAQRFPEHIGLVSNYALVLLLSQQVNEAYSEAENALRLDPRDSVTRNLLGLIKEVQSGKRQCPKSLNELN
jgi:Tfp pilus assembly protein PilF